MLLHDPVEILELAQSDDQVMAGDERRATVGVLAVRPVDLVQKPGLVRRHELADERGAALQLVRVGARVLGEQLHLDHAHGHVLGETGAAE